MYGTRLLPVRRDCLPPATRRFYSDFSTVLFDVSLLLRAAGVRFLLLVFDEENVLLLKYNQSRISQARDKQVEIKQDQSMKGCSHKELDKETIYKRPQQLTFKATQDEISYMFEKHCSEKLHQGLTLFHSAILRCALFVFGSHRC